MKQLVKIICLFSFSLIILITNCHSPEETIFLLITPSNITLSPLETYVLRVTGGPKLLLDNSDVYWESSNPDVVIADESGRLTALHEGNTIITASYKADPDQFTECTVSVISKELVPGKFVGGDCSSVGTRWYTSVAATGCDYIIEWMDAGEGSYTGDVLISAYTADIKTSYFESSTSGSEIIHTENCEKVYIKVEPENTPGTFALKYSFLESTSENTPETWTLLFYINCYNLDGSGIANLEEIINGYHDHIGINVVILIDKETDDDYGIDGLDFSGTGLFIVQPDGLNRISWIENQNELYPELNMGDASTVRKFIDVGKEYFPATKFALIFICHGYATGGFSGDDIEGDRLHPGELSNELTDKQSVNLLGFNSCLMGNIEIAYEFGFKSSPADFSADIMLAPPGFTHRSGWKYDTAFQRISTVNGGEITDEEEIVTGNREAIYDPALMTPAELGLVLLEEHRDGMYEYSNTYARMDSLNCFDLTDIGLAKKNLDIMAISLYENNEKAAIEAVRDDREKTYNYFRTYYSVDSLLNRELTYNPYYDLKSLCKAVVADVNNFSEGTRNAASLVVENINSIILYSYLWDYVSYDDMYGLSVFFSNGDLVYHDQEMFFYQWWYNAMNMLYKPSEEDYYGELAWCIDKENNRELEVDNWFELLDAWYDDPELNPINGGYNGYIY